MIDDLVESWSTLARQAGAVGDPAPAGLDLLTRWAEPHRAYHTVAHLRHVLESVTALDPTRPMEVGLAAWFHDAVYDPTAPPGENEERSAALAVQVLGSLGVAEPVRSEVARLVRLTAGHLVGPDDPAGALLVDADLAVLGSPATAYDDYVAAVRREYAAVDDEGWRVGRAAVLRHLLGRDPLYVTPHAQTRWEAQARRNVVRELTALHAA